MNRSDLQEDMVGKVVKIASVSTGNVEGDDSQTRVHRYDIIFTDGTHLTVSAGAVGGIERKHKSFVVYPTLVFSNEPEG